MIVDRQSAHRVTRGVAHTFTLTAYADDAVTPLGITSGTATVRRGGETLETGAVTVAANQASFSVPATAETEALSDNWDIVWQLDTDDGPQTHREPVWHVYTPIRHGLTVTRFERTVAGASDFHSSVGDKINEAWDELLLDLEAKGLRVHLITDAHMLYPLHVRLTAAMLFEDAAQSMEDARYAARGAEYRQRYEAKLETTTFRYDHDRDGVADEGEYSTAQPAVIWGNPHRNPRMGRRRG